MGNLWCHLFHAPLKICHSPVVRVGENIGSVFLRLGKELVKLLHKVVLRLKQADKAGDIVRHKPPPLRSIA